MLHEAQRTVAPSACSVSMSTAVWMVMWSDPEMRAPLSGWVRAYSSRIAIRPGISVSAMAISLRPKSASDRSATLWSAAWVAAGFSVAFILDTPNDRSERRVGYPRPVEPGGLTRRNAPQQVQWLPTQPEFPQPAKVAPF